MNKFRSVNNFRVIERAPEYDAYQYLGIEAGIDSLKELIVALREADEKKWLGRISWDPESDALVVWDNSTSSTSRLKPSDWIVFNEKGQVYYYPPERFNEHFKTIEV